MAATHTFEIRANGLAYAGEIDTNESGVLSYTENQPEELPGNLDTDFKRLLEVIGNFIEVYGSLEKFEVKEIVE